MVVDKDFDSKAPGSHKAYEYALGILIFDIKSYLIMFSRTFNIELNVL